MNLEERTELYRGYVKDIALSLNYQHYSKGQIDPTFIYDKYELDSSAGKILHDFAGDYARLMPLEFAAEDRFMESIQGSQAVYRTALRLMIGGAGILLGSQIGELIDSDIISVYLAVIGAMVGVFGAETVPLRRISAWSARVPYREKELLLNEAVESAVSRLIESNAQLTKKNRYKYS